jgi:poly(3-hydroxyalkanoate) synthetase
MADTPSVVDFWLWPLQWGQMFSRAPAKEAPEIAWLTPNEIVADLPSMRLRRFAARRRGAAPVVVVAPFAVHDAQIADLAGDHSLVAALAASGLGTILLTEWKSATTERASQSIDSYLADLNIAVDLAGGRPDLVGLCQGGWMSLLYAAAFPAKVRRLVVAGAPVDTSHPSVIAQNARLLPPLLVEEAIAADGGLVNGATTLAAFRASGGAETQSAAVLQIEPDSDPAALGAFAAWDARTLDLPGRYYTDVLNWLFRENRLAEGTFPAFGRPTPLSQVVAPLYLLAGSQDAIAPPPQVRAAMDLVGTPPENIVYAEADCGHLSLFLGARTLREEWPKIGEWLRANGE